MHALGMTSLDAVCALTCDTVCALTCDTVCALTRARRYLQKVLRELGVINLVVDSVQSPFTKGVPLSEMARPNKDGFGKLVTLINMQYRLLKQMCKEDLVNSRALYAHLPVLRSHLGKGILCTPTIKEIFAGKRELLGLIDADLIDHFVALLQAQILKRTLYSAFIRQKS